MGKSNKHLLALQYLAKHPEIIGLDRKNVLTAAIEQTLFQGGKFICDVDLVYMTRGPKALIIEYKANGHDKRLVERGNSQLERAVDHYQKFLGIPAEGRLITGNSYPILLNVKRNGNI